jgi:hypothetical protein
MKKRKLRAELLREQDKSNAFTKGWLEIWHLVGREAGDLGGLVEVVARRMRSLAQARKAARLWKRAAKRYRGERDWERTGHRNLIEEGLHADCERLREERDAARADVGYVRQELNLARNRLRDTAQILIDGIVLADGPMNAEEAARKAIEAFDAELKVAEVERDAARRDAYDLARGREEAIAERDAAVRICTAERDAAIAAADSRHAKLVEVADKLRASRVDVDILQKAMASMRPVVEAAFDEVDNMTDPGNPAKACHHRLTSAVEAYRAGGEAYERATTQEVRQRIETREKLFDPSLPDIQRNYRAPDGDTAERIAADVKSGAIDSGVVRRRIEALVEAARISSVHERDRLERLAAPVEPPREPEAGAPERVYSTDNFLAGSVTHVRSGC